MQLLPQGRSTLIQLPAFAVEVMSINRAVVAINVFISKSPGATLGQHWGNKSGCLAVFGNVASCCMT